MRRAAILILTLAATLTATGSAFALQIVDDDGAQCPRATHTTVQGGINAARPNEKVLVCDGFYREHVQITGAGKDGVRLVADHPYGAVLAPPPNAATGVVNVSGADRVSVRRFLIEGPFSSDGCPPNLPIQGVGVNAGAKGVTIGENDIQFIYDPDSPDCGSQQEGISVLVRGNSRATIIDNRIVGFQDTGVRMIDGGGGQVDGNVISGNGLGRTSQEGITFSTTAPVTIIGNRVSQLGERNADPNRDITGIGILGLGAAKGALTIKGNRIGGDPVAGISGADTGLTIGFQDGGLVRNNVITGNREVGIALADNAANLRLERNDARGNGNPDCQDGSAGARPDRPGAPFFTTANRWAGNRGSEAFPAGICTA